jgi:hypothetical protein
VHRRPVALVLALAAGDYLLWNWSLQSGHDILALISGLTLPPLAITLIWLFVLNVGRLLARSARHPRASGAARAARHPVRRQRGGQTPSMAADATMTRDVSATSDSTLTARGRGEAQTAGGPQGEPPPSSKLAA